MMKPPTKFSFFSSSTTTVTYTFHNDHTSPNKAIEIPIQSPPPPPSSNEPPIPISQSDAATKIQSAYRSHLIRTLYKEVSSINSEADLLQAQIQKQETVDAIRSDEREKLRMNEELMRLLLRLDAVPGVDLTVREARRKVSRRIVGLQEILDAICEANFSGDDGSEGRLFLKDWDEVLGGMEEEFCRERGGEEMERFCAEYLGFRCLQRFLREP